MKVVCDACQAKYQIPDERVAGRKLKIRCRKCGNAIVVRGEQASGEVQTISSIPPAAEAPPRTIEWHVSVEGEQHGPYATEQMGSMLRAGQLAWDAFVWRESYADWKSAGESDTLVRAVAATADEDLTATAQVPHPAAAAYLADEDPTRLAQSPTGEALQPVARVAFATRAAASQPPMAAAGHAAVRAMSQPPVAAGYAAAAGANGANYAPRALSQVPAAAGYAGPRVVSQPPSFASYAQPAAVYSHPHADATMTGERNEDSVLFSARNLALAASPGVATAPSTQNGGYASGEGSGLIDIRALAALAHTQPQMQQQDVPIARPQFPGVANDVRSSDALLRMANQTGAFAHLDSLAPMDRASQAPNRAVPLAILGGSAMIAAAAFVALYIFRPQPASQPVAAASSAVPSVGIAEPAQPAPEPAQAAAPEPEAAPAQVAKAEPVEPADEPADEPAVPARATSLRGGKSQKTVSAKRAAATDHSAPHAAKSEPARASAKDAKAPKETDSAKKSASVDDMLLGDSGKKSEPKPEPKAAPTPDDDLLAGPMPTPAKKDPGKSRSIDDLLDDAVPGKGGSKPASEAASAALPETPTREQVLSAMHGVEPDVKACAEGQSVDSSSAQAAITVTGATGRVTSVHVTGIQGAIGSCVARAVRAATFPKFAKAQLSINFPFKLK